MGSSRNRRRAIALVIVAVVVLSGCQNLPKRVAGKKCPIVGEHAQDGTWVLKCGSNKRWNRLMTIADANAAVADWLRSQAPAPAPAPAPTTTAAPAPAPATSFGNTDSTAVAERTGALRPGTYFTRPTGTYCGVEVLGGATRRRLGKEGPLYIDLGAGDTVRASGGCTWTLGAPGAQAIPASGNGMYRVGTEIQPGLYTAPGGPECYWETSTTADASLATVTDLYYGDGPQLAQIDNTDKYFVSDDCGTWTPLTATPARYLEVASSLNNYPLQGHRAFYQGSQFSVVPTTTSTSVSTPAFNATIAPPPGGPFSNGTFPVSRLASPVAGNVLVDLTSPGRGCNSITGTATVSDVVLDGSGVATAMHVVVLGHCDGEAFGLNLRY